MDSRNNDTRLYFTLSSRYLHYVLTTLHDSLRSHGVLPVSSRGPHGILTTSSRHNVDVHDNYSLQLWEKQVVEEGLKRVPNLSEEIMKRYEEVECMTGSDIDKLKELTEGIPYYGSSLRYCYFLLLDAYSLFVQAEREVGKGSFARHFILTNILHIIRLIDHNMGINLSRYLK